MSTDMCVVIVLSYTAVVWNMNVHSGATRITVHWSRPVNAPYLDHAVQYVVAISGKLISSGRSKSCITRVCVICSLYHAHSVDLQCAL